MRSRYAIEMGLWRAKNMVGRGIAYSAPLLMLGVGGKAIYDVANDIMRKNAVKQQAAPKAEPQVKATSLRH